MTDPDHEKGAAAAADRTQQKQTQENDAKNLLDFLRRHDAECPACGYNLRALTKPICPECGQELVLTVGATRLHLGWLFIAIAPGFCSGIAAFFVLFPTLWMYYEMGAIDPGLGGAVLFGWGSGIFAILLARKRHRFAALSHTLQAFFAFLIWLVHLAVLVLLIIYIVSQF